ncbi:MAG: radical SAM protein [Candidatus Sumerlaeia bacterium]|nr:radical SAM protein [Candidatus Sumerlaeia bacterium]
MGGTLAATPPGTEVDSPRAINDVLTLLDQTYLSERTVGRPTHYDIAVSVVCNIKCPFCPRQTFGDEVKSGLLKQEHFDPVAPHLEVSHKTGLYGLGEPFLNKNFMRYLKETKARGSYAMTSSHGMSLTSEMIDTILDSGLDELCVSMDGPTPRTFNFLRDGADFDTVCRNVGELLRRRGARGQELPRVHIACAVSKYNVWHMAGMVRLALRLGADRLVFSNLVLDHPEHAHASIVGTRMFHWNLARAKKAAERAGLECFYFPQKPFPWLELPNPAPRKGVRHGCPSAWRSLIIERDGNVKPCCYLATSFGNTAEAPMEEIFNSGKARELRRSFIEGTYWDACKGCGQFSEITPERTLDLIGEAEAAARAGAFSDGVRERLLHTVAHFRELAAAAK